MVINVRDVRGENINWYALGQRFKKFREARHMSCLETAQAINLTESQIARFEDGFDADRKSTNIVWNISLRWNLSINWLLNGLGKPHDPDPLSLMPETLHVQKGAGVRRNYNRLEAEEGNFTDHVLEFVIAIDKFKNKHSVPFPTLTQIYEIITALGYRKSAPPRIAPLGYIVEHQQWAEKLKQMNEKIEASPDLNNKEDRETRVEEYHLARKRKAEVERKAIVATLRVKKIPLKVLYNIKHREQRATAPAAGNSISATKKQRRLKIRKSTQARDKRFIFIDSTGRQYIVDNLPQFCREMQLKPAHMYSVAKGDRKQHKGWRAEVIPECANQMAKKQEAEQPDTPIISILERIRSGLK